MTEYTIHHPAAVGTAVTLAVVAVVFAAVTWYGAAAVAGVGAAVFAAINYLTGRAGQEAEA